MFAYSRYGGDGDDDGAAADIYSSISTDGGESFGEPYVLITHTEMNADNIMSASFMRMANGDIGLFFLRPIRSSYRQGRRSSAGPRGCGRRPAASLR